MTQKPALGVEVGPCTLSSFWVVSLVCGNRRAFLPNNAGYSYSSRRSDALERAKWWAEKLGLLVTEVEG